jgi:excisionase family DNA binding protein
MFNGTETILSINEAAEVLGVSRIRVYQMVTRKELPSFKFNGKFIAIRLSDVERLKQDRAARGLFGSAKHEA